MKFSFTKFSGYYNLAVGIANLTAAMGSEFGFQAACGILNTLLGCVLLGLEKDNG